MLVNNVHIFRDTKLRMLLSDSVIVGRGTLMQVYGYGRSRKTYLHAVTLTQKGNFGVSCIMMRINSHNFCPFPCERRLPVTSTRPVEQDSVVTHILHIGALKEITN